VLAEVRAADSTKRVWTGLAQTVPGTLGSRYEGARQNMGRRQTESVRDASVALVSQHCWRGGYEADDAVLPPTWQ
jgi:hypothetical protein